LASICLRSIACVVHACWHSTAATRPKREQLSQPPLISPGVKVPWSSSVARTLHCPSLQH